MLSFVLYDLNDKSIVPDNILSYELSRDADAHCDGLRLTFAFDGSLDEVYGIEAYQDGERVFNGYVDTQRETLDEKGYTVFIYARSAACILVDNEAEPRSYYQPSLLSLYELYAKDFGFASLLPDMVCNSDYLVGKGTSCYDAINSLALGLTGKSIMVDNENRLYIPDGSNRAEIPSAAIVSEKRIINRGEAISTIDYKINNDLEYSYHLESRYMKRHRINRKRKRNISNLPIWQQELVLKNAMNSACRGYSLIELVLDGCHMMSPYSIADYSGAYYESNEGYFVSSCKVILDSRGERTKIILSRQINPEEITYVAE